MPITRPHFKCCVQHSNARCNGRSHGHCDANLLSRKRCRVLHILGASHVESLNLSKRLSWTNYQNKAHIRRMEPSFHVHSPVATHNDKRCADRIRMALSRAQTSVIGASPMPLQLRRRKVRLQRQVPRHRECPKPRRPAPRTRIATARSPADVWRPATRRGRIFTQILGAA